MFSDLESSDIKIRTAIKFTDDYKNSVFMVWYNHGKPVPKHLYEIIPVPETNFGVKPTYNTLQSWISSDAWKSRAAELDAGVRENLDRALVVTKVEMLERHARIGEMMQDLALQYLQEHVEDMSAPAAVRLLVEGIRIQRDSLGIPGALKKVNEMSNEQLYDEVKKLIEETPLENIEDVDETSE